MASARLDIEIEEHSDLTFEFTYKDAQGNPNDLTNWGGAIVFSEDKDSEPFYVGYAADSDTPLLIGGTDGLIEVQVPYTYFLNLETERGLWELYIYPTAGDITDRPKRLIEGSWEYNRSLI